MRPALLTLLLAVSAAAPAEEISIQAFLRRLAQEHQFEIQGLGVVGNATFTPVDSRQSPDFRVARALRQFNHVVKYANGEISGVIIFGRKGANVGSLPDSDEAGPVEEQ